MSIYTDNIQDMLADDSKIAIRQLESDAMAGNLEATYLLGKVYYDESTTLLTQIKFLDFGRKAHKTVALTVCELWVIATSLALAMKKAMKRQWKFTMKF